MSLFHSRARANKMVRKKKNPVLRNNDTLEQSVMKAIEALKLSEPVSTIMDELQTLYNILSYRRGAGSNGELTIIRRYIASLPGCVRDGFGNYHLQIPMVDGSASKVMWSCHTDTVHNAKPSDDRQKLLITTKAELKLADNQLKECLGADDGAGMWLMLQMIKNGVPGYYLFHRDEEHGRNGSRWVANNLEKECKLSELDYSIAFDRRGGTSIITYQSGTRCCSDEFATSMSKAMEKSGVKWRTDTGGSFTDTASYTKIIKECTNLSVGYTGAHGSFETQDVLHLLKMREALISFDESILVAKRDPSKVETRTSYSGSGYHGYGSEDYSRGYGQRQYKGMSRYYYQGDVPILKDRYRMARLIESYSLEIAELMQADGFDADLLYDMINEMEQDENYSSANVIHIGKKKDEPANDIEKKIETKTISQDILGNDMDTADPPIQGPANKPPVFKKDYTAGDKTFSELKAQSPAAILGEQVREEAAKLSNEARMKAQEGKHVSQTGVYCNEELMLLSNEHD